MEVEKVQSMRDGQAAEILDMLILDVVEAMVEHHIWYVPPPRLFFPLFAVGKADLAQCVHEGTAVLPVMDSI